MTIRLPEFSHQPDPDYQYVSDPMGRIGRGTWRRRRKADPFGRTEADWEFEALRKDFDLRKPLQRIFRDRSLDLAQPVGRDADNDPFDVALIETLLAKTGLFDLGRTEGPTGHYGTALEDAIRDFQKSANLKIDGRINPGGPTFAALNARLAEGEKAGDDGDDGGGDKDATPAERKPADLLEMAMQRRRDPFPPSPGEILDGRFPGGAGGGAGGGARGQRPMPPVPPVDPPRRPDP
ncbi:MAG: peptidoglycan-binding protein, partial [Alphaproteobacteria bacterium]|nr:peptidoglycan-binding protein [Alphaproteobacteria bacterium]